MLFLPEVAYVVLQVRGKFAGGVQGLEPTEQQLMEKEAHRDCLVTADTQVRLTETAW